MSNTEFNADIVIIIVGSPKNHIIASHHEKLLLIDPECPDHAVAFIGVKKTKKNNLLFPLSLNFLLFFFLKKQLGFRYCSR